MSVYFLQCPDCGHQFKGMVMALTEPPREWVCSKCGGRRVGMAPGTKPAPHPWDAGIDQNQTGRRMRLGHPLSCPCCL
jgi:hypothetical protein